jgi:hypothetical protein
MWVVCVTDVLNRKMIVTRVGNRGMFHLVTQLPMLQMSERCKNDVIYIYICSFTENE